MDIVLGVSMTPTTVRMVLVEGEEADGMTSNNDVFDITAVEGVPTSSASERVSSGRSWEPRGVRPPAATT